MSNSNRITGIVTFIPQGGDYATVTTEDGTVRLYANKAGSRKEFIRLGSTIECSVTLKNNPHSRGSDDRYLRVADQVFSAILPKPILAKLVSLNSKGIGRVAFKGGSALLPRLVWEEYGIEPTEGMKMLAVVLQLESGSMVVDYEESAEIDAAYDVEFTEVGVLKYFDAKTGIGWLIRENGSKIPFALSNVEADLRDNFKMKYPKGSTFRFAVGDYRGKETALIRKLVALAPEREVAAVEGVEVEVGEDEQSSEPAVAAVVETEAKPAKAPRKKAAKPEAEAPAKPKAKRVRKPKEAKPAPEPVEEAPADLAALAKEACQNGGGALAQAMLRAVTPMGNA